MLITNPKISNFEGPGGKATIVLSKKIKDLPEGSASTFPLTVVFFSSSKPLIPCYYHCWKRTQAEATADQLAKYGQFGKFR